VPTEASTAESIAGYTPAPKKTEKANRAASSNKRGAAESYSPVGAVGARVTPAYVERTPQMWAVSEVDIKAISTDGTVANVAFALGSFLLGVGADILISYGSIEKLTDLGTFMLHDATVILFGGWAFCYAFGGYMLYQKKTIWDQIKRESKAKPQP
jgi:hypothetical protein